ncbi:cob(I)yrinic acid a,c-diamide adenosyltransferase [Candidatus Woesebacteria bacterium]|nr:cob(I)yrinic acid a,c-diamide adenosyltransferase [Candidatus Woesebacteria bacterium]
MNSGLVYAFTGEGKGKTSAALGVATRSLLNGEKVVWIAFYKQESWGLSESKLKEKFPNLEMIFVGKGFKIANGQQLTANGKVKIAKVGDKGNVVVDTASEEEHVQAAKEGLVVMGQKLSDKPFLLVMDEVLNAVSEGLLEEKEVMEVLEKRGGTHIVLTGRSGEPTRRLLSGADLVTECKKIKHPYDMGKLAVKGLDF